MRFLTRPRGIRARLTITYILILTIILVGFGALSYRILENRLDRSLSAELAQRSAALRGYLQFDNGEVTLSFDPSDPDEAYFVQASTRFYQVYNIKTGKLLAQSSQLNLLGLELTPEEVRTMADGQPFYDVDTDDGGLRFLNQVIHPAPGEAYLFQVGVSMRQMQDALDRFFNLLLWLIPAALSLASLAGWWAAGRALRPVVALASSVQEIGVFELSRRLPLRGTNDELDQLASAFNDMLGRLSRTIDEMKQFTASVSHELRTPLAILRGEAEVALMHAHTIEDFRHLTASQLEEFDKLTRMINQLLTLARAEAGEIVLNRNPVDLCHLAKSLTEQMIPVAESRGIQLTQVCRDEAIRVSGDSSWLERVILNLLDNALKFTDPGGHVAVDTYRTDNRGIFEVSDTGEGIPADAIPRIFERFYQADPSRSAKGGGAGLGLSLVKWVVDQHGGTIDVSSKPGAGSTFRITLPLIKTT